jgi:multiple sugar transport system substrate-binding protein
MLLGFGAGAAAVLPACDAVAGTGGQASPGAVPTLRSGVTLQWMHPNDSAAHQDAREQQIAAFRQQHAGIQIERQPSPDFQTKLQAAFAAGTPPDLFFSRVTFLTGQVANKQAVALDDLIKRDRFPLTDFYQTGYEQYRVQGKLHALPFDYPNRSFFMNVTAFQEAGVNPPPNTYKDNSWTWDTFRTAMEGLQRRFGTEGGTHAVDTGREVRAWIAWVWNNGGDLFSKDNRGSCSTSPQGWRRSPSSRT